MFAVLDGFCRSVWCMFRVSIMGVGSFRMRCMCIMTTMCGMDSVFAVLHPVNDRAGTHKQQRLEEGVGDQVKGSGNISADAKRRDHETKLADRGVGQHLLDVILRDGNRRRE